MKALVISGGDGPHYTNFPEAVAGQGEELARMTAFSLKNIDKAMASGAHYHEHDAMQAHICGVDGVGVLANGTHVYFGSSREPYGTMAEVGIVNQRWQFPLPAGLDDVTAAAIPNPAMSSWLPLVYRAKLQVGETVLILGATGVSGKLAVQIAKHLGAGRVIAAGHNPHVLKSLPLLGADEVISLDQADTELAATFRAKAGGAGYDVILDYVWGHPAQVLIDALTGKQVDKDASKPIRYVSIGSMAGPRISLHSAALRSTTLELYGSGGGSIPHSAIFETFPRVMALAAEGKLKVDTLEVPLAGAEKVWGQTDPNGRRIVFVL